MWLKEEQIVEKCKEFIKVKNEFLSVVDVKDPKFGFTLSLGNFALLMAAAFVPQSYGSRIEGRIAKELCLPRSDNKDRGDRIGFVNGIKCYYEIKCSLITNTNHSINLVQLRPHQNINGYYVFVADLRNANDIPWWIFYLDKRLMDVEIEFRGCSAHGTIDALKGNTNNEARISLDIDDPHFKYWLNNFVHKTNKK